MEMSKKSKKAGMLIGTLVTIVSVACVAFLLVMLSGETALPTEKEPEFPEDHLFVDANYLLKTDETNDSVNVSVILYLTNILEKESGTIKATAFVIETNNNFAVDKNNAEIGKIKEISTSEIEIPVELSNNVYKIDVLIFEDDLLVLKGELTISSHPRYTWDEIKHSGTDDDGDGYLLKQVWDVENSKAPNWVRIRE